ncbi:hypothetical protein COV23_01990 [Candidatus Wolfebacteria bacterium CG10_big_fil_rev_8_21_14_0_10_31_9]|uniref:HD domain-containing protein n=1 Tax=Candidatus Wolfebacteria bacterium CG10_big_fil_rev_8_21_14_0_10_31_9 TaxID=1975070 RepID=A0A2H0RC16_9BACT|nr:MAG: hypothetical protein COV23_01990 [Candidatus Wolfebacteria bacterium CG10_big_fil_rev_8_21_14_0_10_31_9]
MKYNIPQEVLDIIEKLEKANFEAYLVGGCVRDLLLKREAKDWDITTNAKPVEVQKIFPDSAYENQFGTVAIKTRSENSILKIIEITTYRVEGKYTDKRHPDEIKFAKTVEEDLSRRDFTINAMSLRLQTTDYRLQQELKKPSAVSSSQLAGLIDPYNGQEDLKKKVICTVGSPEDRFNEDALRLLRAIRFSTELDFEIEKETERAIKKQAGLLEMIAKERIRDEFIKIIMSENAKNGIEKLEEFGLLKYIIPELRAGIDITQDHHHIYTVWEHNLRSLDYTVKKKYPFEIRLASLFHDIGKPITKAGKSPNSTFYNHEIVGAKIVVKILDRLHFPKDISEKIIHLVRYHMFYYNVGEVSEAGVRRFLARVGPENVDDLIKIREADRIGSGVPKAVPYKLRHLLFMIDKVKRDPISPKMLKINGSDIMSILKITPGPKIGKILSALLEEVLDDPKKNVKKYLESKAKELNKISEKDLEKLFKKAKEKKDEFEGEAIKEIKGKFFIK